MKLLKKLFHIHKYTTLLIYEPKNNSEYGFLLRCDCNYTKPTKLPITIKEVFFVRNNINGE